MTRHFVPRGTRMVLATDVAGGGGGGGGGGTPNAALIQNLREWTEADAFQMLSITYDSTITDVVSTATGVWPDGSTGTWTTTAINAALHQWDSFTITHDTSGYLVTQPALTRDVYGEVLIEPELVIAHG